MLCRQNPRHWLDRQDLVCLSLSTYAQKRRSSLLRFAVLNPLFDQGILTPVFQRKALTAAILSLREADVQERMLHSDVTYINTDKKVKALVNSTIKKMPKDVQRVLNNENSTIADFFALQQLHEEDSGEGVYLIMYQKPDDTVGFYVGTTVGFRRRFNDHRAAAAAGKGGFHYKFARQAKITHRVCLTCVQGKQHR